MQANSIRWIRAVAAGAALTLVAGLGGLNAAHAQSTTVTNTATVSPPNGVTDSNPGNNTSSATVTINAAAAYSFCAAPSGTATSNAVYSIVNGINIHRYEPGTASDALVPELTTPVPGDLNALMIDPVRDRLLFISRPTSTTSTLWAYDADNGGWYQAVVKASASGELIVASLYPVTERRAARQLKREK